MKPKTIMLATPDVLLEINNRAVEGLYGEWVDPQNEGREVGGLTREQMQAAVDGIRFCASAAALLRESALLPALCEGLRALEFYDWLRHWESILVVLRGITSLLGCGVPPKEVAALAKHEKEQVRYAVAAGLVPTSEEAIALLELLSADPVPEVRRAAQEKLASVGELAWWRGKFSSDPLVGLSPEEGQKLKPALERIAAILGGDTDQLVQGAKELISLTESLPEALAGDLALRTLSSFTVAQKKELAPLGALLFRLPMGYEALHKLADAWVPGFHSFWNGPDVIARMLRELPTEQRLSLLKKIVEDLQKVAPEERGEIESKAKFLTEVVQKCWPARADISFLLDAIFVLLESSEGQRDDWAAQGLISLLTQPGVKPGPSAGRMFEAMFAGYPGRWEKLKYSIDRLLTRAPREALRPAAREALASENEKLRAWGVKQVLGNAYDPEQDPPHLEMVRRFLEEPRCRPLFFAERGGLLRKAIPLLRVDLCQGKLSFSEAHKLLHAIGDLYSGVILPLFQEVKSEMDREVLEESCQKAIEETGEPFLGSLELRHPPTEEEWSAYRLLREGARAVTPLNWQRLLEVLPEGPWHPEDRALLSRYLSEHRPSFGDVLDYLVLGVLAAKPDVEYVSLVGTLLEEATESSRLIESFAKTFYKRLGIVRPALPKKEEPKDETEWMDQEEEDQE